MVHGQALLMFWDDLESVLDVALPTLERTGAPPHTILSHGPRVPTVE